MSIDFSSRRKQLMPSPSHLVREAQEVVSTAYAESMGSKNLVAERLDDLIQSLLDEEYSLFRKYEHSAGVKILTEYLTGGSWTGSDDIRDYSNISEYASQAFSDLDALFMSMSMSRISRAKNSFEKHLTYLFNILELPFEEQQVINGKPDFLFPNAEMYRTNPSDVILITAKRTLRERWRQIIIEGVRTPRYFLATIDPRQSKQSLDEMAQNRVWLVVPQQIIAGVSNYIDAPNVISFRTLYADYLLPASARW